MVRNLPHADVDYERLLLDNLGLIDEVVHGIARRHRLADHEVGDLRDAIRLKLVENDYDVLRRFEQRCSLRTYLAAVVHRFFLDTRNAKWGKWRPSVEARRAGPVAVLLERLLTRDGVSFDQAVQMLRINHKVDETPEALYELSVSFPAHKTRRFVSEDVLLNSSGGSSAEDQLEQAEQTVIASAVTKALASALSELSTQDRLILKLRFLDDIPVAQVARLLRIEVKPLYRRLEQLMTVLRRALEKQGIGKPDIERLIGSPMVELQSVVEGAATGNSVSRPSVR